MAESSRCISQSPRCLRRSRPSRSHPSRTRKPQDAPGRRRKLLCPICRQIGEDDDERFVDCVVALSRLSVHEQSLVTVDELDHICHAPIGGLLRSKPKSLALQGSRHEGTHGPGAAKILVRPDHESLDPACDGAMRIEIAFRELAHPADVLELLEEEEISGLCWHGTFCWKP